MCTSIALLQGGGYFGRNLDLEYSFGEQVVIMPRLFPLHFHRLPSLTRHFSMIGMANVAEGYPLYAEAVNGCRSPKVRLLSNGVEEGKGSDEGKAAYKLLREDHSVNFQGNVEASKVLTGDSDVVVTSGYDGNVLLKSTEGAAKGMSGLIKKAFMRNIFSKLGYLLSKKGFDGLKKTLDPRSTGGALLCGVRAVAVKAHGNSDGLGFSNAIEVAYRLANKGIVESLEKAMEGK